MKQWNLGNTTLRNPGRISGALKLFAEEFVGRKWSEAAELKFATRLKNVGLIESDAAEASSGIHGRKFAAAFNQLGLAVASRKSQPARLLPAGEALLRTEEPGDVFLRQLLKYQLPSPKERRASPEFFSVHPLWVVLKVSFDLHVAGEDGLSVEECALFVNTCVQDEDAAVVVERIRNYRAKLKTPKGQVAREKIRYTSRVQVARALYREELQLRRRILEELYKTKPSKSKAEFMATAIVRSGKGAKTTRALQGKRKILDGLKNGRTAAEVWREIEVPVLLDVRASTLLDYGDTTLRYSMITELFELRGKRFGLKASNAVLVEGIVSTVPGIVPDGEYESYLADPKQPKLLLDEREFVAEQVNALRAEANAIVTELKALKSSRVDLIREQLSVIDSSSRSQLKMEVRRLRELRFYVRHDQPEEVRDVEKVIKAQYCSVKVAAGGSRFGGAGAGGRSARCRLAGRCGDDDAGATGSYSSCA